MLILLIKLLKDEITKEHADHIGGVAMGSAALGMGQLEDVKRAFYVTQMPFERPFHLHILGVGALRRMLPFILFKQNGLYKNINISYDSTTHSMSLDNGLFYFSFYNKQLDIVTGKQIVRAHV